MFDSPLSKKLNAAVIFEGDSLSGSFKKKKITTLTPLPQDGAIAVQCNNLSNIPHQGHGLLIAYTDSVNANAWRLAVVMKIPEDSDEIHCCHLDDEGDYVWESYFMLLAVEEVACLDEMRKFFSDYCRQNWK